MKNWIVGGDRSEGQAEGIALLVLRVFTGLSMAAAHGWPKAASPASFLDSVAEMGFPLAEGLGWAAIVAELVGGICLALGLGTRLSAFLIAVTMLVAAFVHHAGDPFGRREKALLYAAIALFFMVKGGGKLSIDAKI